MKNAFIVLFICSVLLLCSCTEPVDPNSEYPLNGKTYSTPTYDTSVLPGTYLAADYFGSNMFDGYGNYYWVSFKSDGTMISSPAKGTTSGFPIDKSPSTGTWSMDGSEMTININSKTYTGTKIDSAGNGFAIKKTNYDNIAFAKVSDDFINTGLASNKNNILGLYFCTNSYGENYGYRFLPESKLWEYDGNKNVHEGTYKVTLNGTIIGINEWAYNVTFIGDYLVIGTNFYQKAR